MCIEVLKNCCFFYLYFANFIFFVLQGISKVHSTLKELSFICCPAIRCSDIGTIAEMVPNLTYLTLAGMFSLIRLNALLPITKLKNLIRLDLEQNSVVCDNFMENLVENCSSLMHLNLSGTFLFIIILKITMKQYFH